VLTVVKRLKDADVRKNRVKKVEVGVVVGVGVGVGVGVLKESVVGVVVGVRKESVKEN